jgi:branched-chain amino acid transport system substrate-binding protein
MKKFYLIGILTALFFVLNMASVYSSDEGFIKIGLIQPLSGSVAAQGQYVLNGTLLALEEINNSGGIKGKKIEIISEDDKATPAEAVAAANKLINRDKVKLILGCFNSSCSLATQEVTRRAKVVQMTPVSTAKSITEQGNTFIFRYAATSEMIMNVLVNYIVSNTDLKRFAFLAENTDQGISALDGFKKGLETYGKGKNVKFVTEEYYNIGDTDFNSQLTKIKNISPPVDVVQTVALITEATLILKQAQALGLKTKFSFMGGPTHSDFINYTKSSSDGILYMSFFEPTIINPKVQKFVSSYEKKFGKKPEMFAAAGYDSLYIAKEAIEKGGYSDTEKLRDALRAVKFEGVQGKTEFDEKGQASLEVLVMTIKDGARKILYPLAFADK